MQRPTDTADRNSRQFNRRALLGVTLAGAVLIGVAVVFRDSGQFHALWSPHALIAALPILGLLMFHATAVVNPRRLACLSLAIYGVALATPAFRLGGDLAFGYLAFLFSFVGIGLWGSFGFWPPFACTMGALANIAFIVGYISFMASGTGASRLTRWLAVLGSCLALLVILPLCFGGKLNGVYIGYGLWATSLLALASGSCRAAKEGQSEQPAKRSIRKSFATEQTDEPEP